jgi:hypothetical protein
VIFVKRGGAKGGFVRSELDHAGARSGSGVPNTASSLNLSGCTNGVKGWQKEV